MALATFLLVADESAAQKSGSKDSPVKLTEKTVEKTVEKTAETIEKTVESTTDSASSTVKSTTHLGLHRAPGGAGRAERLGTRQLGRSCDVPPDSTVALVA